MTPDELRALAGKLRKLQAGEAYEAAAYLRACADAKPVAHYAMLDSHRRLVEQAIQSAEHPSGMSTHDGKARIDASILRRMLAIIDSLSAVPAGWKLVPVDPTPEMLASTSWPGCAGTDYAHMLAAAPAAPQAEPCIGNDSACPCQDGDACHYKDAADGTKAWPVPQAEPKREPLPGLAPTHRCPACGAFWRQCDDASWNLRSASCCGLCDAGRVELVRLLDEPKREPSLGELMREQRQSRIVAGAYPDGNPNAGAMMAQTRQAEPKRGLTCLWSRADDDTDMWETSCGHAFTIIDGTPSDNHMGFCCYCGRRVDEEIGGSDAE